MIDEPLTVDELAVLMNDEGYVSETVIIDFDDILRMDFEGFLDLLSLKLIGCDLLCDISWQIQGCDPSGEMRITVTGCLDQEILEIIG